MANLIDEVEVLQEFVREGDATEEDLEAQYDLSLEAVEELEFRSTLNRQEDELGAVLEINAGAGGTEACDWAEMLLRMYAMWAERRGFKINELNRQDGDVAGIKSAELEVAGDFAYGWLKGENGVHRRSHHQASGAAGATADNSAASSKGPSVSS